MDNFIYIGCFAILFFRTLSQDDQDDNHLKIEDIIQMVGSSWELNINIPIEMLWVCVNKM